MLKKGSKVRRVLSKPWFSIRIKFIDLIKEVSWFHRLYLFVNNDFDWEQMQGTKLLRHQNFPHVRT